MNFTYYSPKKSEFSHKIIKTIATLSESGSYRTILAIVQYGQNKPKHDIRTFQVDADGVEHCCKGKALTSAELRKLKEALMDYEIPDDRELSKLK